jgi:hypothetical protein
MSRLQSAQFVAGFHQIAIYGNGTRLSDIDATKIPPAPAPPFIDDPRNRIYRGLRPASLFISSTGMTAPGVSTYTALSMQDRVEVVQFTKPGRYLVICAFLPHFRDETHGFVTVLP